MNLAAHLCHASPSELRRFRREVESSVIMLNEVASDLVDFLDSSIRSLSILDEAFCFGRESVWLYDMLDRDTTEVIDRLETTRAQAFLQGIRGDAQAFLQGVRGEEFRPRFIINKSVHKDRQYDRPKSK